ncbi:MAG: DUF5830 family protein [Haloarculaceae archaeon]
MSDVARDVVELGVDLLANLEYDELSLKETIDRIEAVTGDPRLIREILETAEDRGVIERDGATIRPATNDFLRFERDVVTKDGEFDCRRCGTGISTGYFIDFEDGEVGPFGSSCIRKVTGRED